jgi:hypothetical protein
MASLYKIHTSSNPSEKGKIVKADRNTLHRIVTAFKAGREVTVYDIDKKTTSIRLNLTPFLSTTPTYMSAYSPNVLKPWCFKL